jgi:hypothetical protein
MRERRVLREVQRREARQALGLSPYGRRLRPSAALRAPFDAEHLALPQATDNLAAIQTADGSFYFMFDFSAFDGPDPWA